MSKLPLPDAPLLARSALLQRRMRDTATSDGSLSFRDYMQQALYTPALGYYVSGLRKFGKDGDFVTAPECSPLFAFCTAQQARQVLVGLGGGDILEFGAGSGTLAGDMLLQLETLNCLPDRYLILELSPDLRQLQRETLMRKVPHLLDRTQWLDTWPCQFKGFAIGNEVLDAMPVERFRWCADRIEQVRVQFTADKPTEMFARAGARLSADIMRLHARCGQDWPRYFCGEINRSLLPWFRGFAQSIASAVLLLIDYGYPQNTYYHPARATGTLRCYYRHRAHDDPYLYPGLQDITAHVDFTAVAEAGTQAGMALEGFISQRQYLFNCDLAGFVEELMVQADDMQRFALSRQVQQLTLPGQMGETFNVIGFSRNLPTPLQGQPLRGFAGNDRAHRL